MNKKQLMADNRFQCRGIIELTPDMYSRQMTGEG